MADQTEKPKLGTRPPLGLKRTVETGKVKQSFSHGRSNTVVVEVKKRRILGRPGEAPPPEAPKPEPVAEAPKPAPKPAAPAAPQPRRRRPSRSPSAAPTSSVCSARPRKSACAVPGSAPARGPDQGRAERGREAPRGR